MKIKICGLFRKEDIRYVNDALPDYIGFVFAPSSKRLVTEACAMELRAGLDSRIVPVGVFRDAPIEQIIRLCDAGTIAMAQLHGGEDEEYMAALRAKRDVPIIKAFSIATGEDVTRAQASSAEYILLDHGRGGTGEAFDWALLKGFGCPFFLAGGIDKDNIEAALGYANFAIDTSSGVETNGKKDRDKICALVETCRAYGANHSSQVADTIKGQKPRKGKGGTMMTKEQTLPIGGRFGAYGGQYVPETLMNEIIDLEQAYMTYREDPAFQAELLDLLQTYAGRPSLLYYAKNMTQDLGGAKVYLKREDLNHTGSHKINNVLGQVLLAKRLGKTRVIAETGAGQHGVATATAAALLGLDCEVFMGEEDTERQALNVYRMRLLGAKVHPVTSGTRTLKDAVNETMREWTNRVHDTHYVLGSVMGPHPFPLIVRDFQSIISKEARKQILEMEGNLPSAVIACVGGGSNAMGMFYHFIPDESVRLIGCEAAGEGLITERHAATIAKGEAGVFHGMKSYFCQDAYGQIAPVYSISAGLDYPGIGPEHAYLHDTGRAEYVSITDEEAVSAFEYLSQVEGIIPAIESAHAVAYARKLVPTLNKQENIILCLSGRGDKDVAAIARYRGEQIHE